MDRDDLLAKLFRDRIALGLVLMVTLANLMYGMLWDKVPVRAGDTSGYIAVAERMQAGEFLQPSFRTQGYPLLLWLCGLPPSKKIVWVGLVLQVLSTLLLVWLLRSIGMSRLSQILLATIMCLPLYVQSAGMLLTENLAQFSLVVTFILWFLSVRIGSVVFGIGAGITAAWCALVRPAYQLLPVLLALMTIIFSALFDSPSHRSRRAVTAISPLVGLILLLCIMAINQVYFGYFALTPALGGNMCNRTALFIERADSRWEPLRSALIKARNEALIRGKSHTALQYQWDHWSQLKEVTGLDDIQLAKGLMRLNASLILENPLEYVAAVVRSISISLFPYVTSIAGNTGGLQVLWTAVHFGLIGFWLGQLWVFGGSSLFVMALTRHDVNGWQRILPHAPDRLQERLCSYWAAFVFIVYTILINSLADVGDPRQRSPVDCFILLQSLIGLEILFFAWHHRKTPDGRHVAVA